MLGRSVTLPHFPWASLQEVVYQYYVSILLPVTDRLLFFNQRKRIIIFPLKNVTDARTDRGTVVCEAVSLPTELLRRLGIWVLMSLNEGQPYRVPMVQV